MIDALDAPHGGRILRLQLQDGPPPRVRDLRGSRLTATAPDGTRQSVTVTGFAAFGGRVSNRRLAETGRVDVHVREDASDIEPVSIKWLLTPS
ncbi:MAG: hypothetical protein F4179_12885 [Gammaproteobacteria bacterium]|nr:hypothetical protein [Gammaproteobacteria bacterium]MXY30912.1 hypothetical protein [Gammaproteobacteria bacterium]MYC99565.1 hypothetical protein [Gammaproteobacteria bacterium]MYF62538.1 hypothetical protein [Gammaproteobacteria bacterium]MYI23677.1 hypothetical protein [Gammaproteobacteria bacterium]